MVGAEMRMESRLVAFTKNHVFSAVVNSIILISTTPNLRA